MSTEVIGGTGRDNDGADLWFRWKRVFESVRSGITGEVTAAAGLAESDLSVLVQLYRADGVLRQNALAAALGWDRTRLSHLVTRMQARGLVERRPSGSGVDVVMTEGGRSTLDAAQQPLRAAVDHHFAGRLSSEDRRHLARILTALDTD